MLILTGVRPASAAAARDRRNAIAAQTVRAHVDAIETRLRQRGRHLGQPHAVGRECDVLDARHAPQHAHERHEIGSYRRLAAGDTQAPQA